MYKGFIVRFTNKKIEIILSNLPLTIVTGIFASRIFLCIGYIHFLYKKNYTVNSVFQLFHLIYSGHLFLSFEAPLVVVTYCSNVWLYQLKQSCLDDI